MKVGDRVRSLRVRPDEIAVVTRADIKIVKNEKKNCDETRTTYTAEFDDKTKNYESNQSTDRTSN